MQPGVSEVLYKYKERNLRRYHLSTFLIIYKRKDPSIELHILNSHRTLRISIYFFKKFRTVRWVREVSEERRL